MHHIPVAGARDDHLPVQEVLVHLIQRRGRPGAPCGNHRSSGFKSKRILFPSRPGEEGPVHKAHQRPVYPGEVHRRAEDKAVIFLCQRGELVDLIVEDALSQPRTGSAPGTAGDWLLSDPEELRPDPFLAERLRRLGQGGIGAALFVGATVYEQHFHLISSNQTLYLIPLPSLEEFKVYGVLF